MYLKRVKTKKFEDASGQKRMSVEKKITHSRHFF